MSCTTKQILDLAKSYIGAKEGSGKHHAIIDTYNAHKPLARGYKVKYNDNWCATFISFLAIKCGATDIIPIECSCGQMIELMKKKGIWQENGNITPKVGDIIMYDWDKKDGWPEHVGIVEEVSGKIITVIEGNKSNAVGRRTIEVGNASIRGYGQANYKKETDTSKPTTKPKNYLSKGDKGSDVKTMQTMLIACGYSCGEHGANGSFGSNTDKSLRKFQKDNDLEVDGKYGNNSKTKLTELYNINKNLSIYYKKYTGKSQRIDEVLKSIGVPSKYYGTWKKRKDIAKKNGIKDYMGTAKQNTTLISLAKQGKIKKV